MARVCVWPVHGPHHSTRHLPLYTEYVHPCRTNVASEVISSRSRYGYGHEKAKGLRQELS